MSTLTLPWKRIRRAEWGETARWIWRAAAHGYACLIHDYGLGWEQIRLNRRDGQCWNRFDVELRRSRGRYGDGRLIKYEWADTLELAKEIGEGVLASQMQRDEQESVPLPESTSITSMPWRPMGSPPYSPGDVETRYYGYRVLARRLPVGTIKQFRWSILKKTGGGRSWDWENHHSGVAPTIERAQQAGIDWVDAQINQPDLVPIPESEISYDPPWPRHPIPSVSGGLHCHEYAARAHGFLCIIRDWGGNPVEGVRFRTFIWDTRGGSVLGEGMAASLKEAKGIVREQIHDLLYHRNKRDVPLPESRAFYQLIS